jgi:hypothetical protein
VALHHQKPQLRRQSAAATCSFAIAFGIQLLPSAPQTFLLSTLHLLFVFLLDPSGSQLHPNDIRLLGSRATLTVVFCRIATLLALLAYPAIDMDHLIVLYQYHISTLSTPRNSTASVYGFVCASRRLAFEVRVLRQEQWPALRVAVLMMTADPVSGKCFCNLWVVVVDLGSFELVVLHASYVLT